MPRLQALQDDPGSGPGSVRLSGTSPGSGSNSGSNSRRDQCASHHNLAPCHGIGLLRRIRGGGFAMSRLQVAVYLLPYLLENTEYKTGQKWPDAAIERAFQYADAVAEIEGKKQTVLQSERDCRICARSTGQRDTQCASVYSCVNGSHYLPTKTVQLWRVG